MVDPIVAALEREAEADPEVVARADADRGSGARSGRHRLRRRHRPPTRHGTGGEKREKRPGDPEIELIYGCPRRIREVVGETRQKGSELGARLQPPSRSPGS